MCHPYIENTTALSDSFGISTVMYKGSSYGEQFMV